MVGYILHVHGLDIHIAMTILAESGLIDIGGMLDLRRGLPLVAPNYLISGLMGLLIS